MVRLFLRSRVVLLVVGTALAVSADLAVPAGAASSESAGPVPASVATLGDSIARGFNACGFYVDCTSRSFATGDSQSVNSHYLRIRSRNSAVASHNDARTGASASDMVAQARTAVTQGADYVAMLVGANDVCRSSEAQMTPASTFRRRIDAALDTLDHGLPTARIFIASIPDVRRLWQVFSHNVAARAVWAIGGICPTMLANPTSTAPADVQRRDRVYQRIVDLNTELARSCASHRRCRFDHDAVFTTAFTSHEVSRWDYFHPNAAGQALLARVTYAAGYNW